MNDTQSELLTLLLVATLIFLIPTIIAFLRRHPNRWVIFLLNTFLGATGIVWFGCLIWACKALHITADPRGTNGGESGLNLTANDVVWVRFENVAPLSPPVSRLPSEDMLNRLERLKSCATTVPSTLINSNVCALGSSRRDNAELQDISKPT